ncbi:MAG TPA: NAD(+) diphosphatase [Steroidobacteraceae bacterium]|nr:NAD(+) diphosphatase [Steroidobacteraceae bacterium]
MSILPAASPFPADPFLERRGAMRVAEDWAHAAMIDPATRFLCARGTTHLMQLGPTATIAFVDAQHAGLSKLDESQLVLLGWFRGNRCVLVELPSDGPDAPPPGTRYEELRPLLPLLHEDEARLLAYCRALLVWRARHRHCGVCGAPTAPRSAGHVLVCSRESCGASFFPRIDPAVIVLVTDGPLALLGRQATWPAGRYSALAGFVEPGESLEEAVAREVEEETGVRVVRAHYFASQPWPFPASLMLGFHATAARGPLRLDDELEDARWFRSDELRAAPDGLLPPPHTIARRLIEEWLRRGAGAPP